MCGNHSSGTPLGIVIFAETVVGLEVSPEKAGNGSLPDLIFSSGNDITMDGFLSACEERTVRLTLTTQSAVWSGVIDGL